MAKIKNTMTRNVYGDGYEKEVTLDNGEKYIIRNTMTKNVYGNGYEKEIVKKDSVSNDSIIGLLIEGAVAVIFMLFLWWLFNNIDIVLNLLY